MKTIVKIFSLSLFLLGVVNMTYAQQALRMDGQKYNSPEDSLECLKLGSVYGEYVKKGPDYYDMAMGAWRQVFDECPGSSKNLYIDGVKLYKHFIKIEKEPRNDVGQQRQALTENRRKEMYDTLLLIYDRRIEYKMGTEHTVLGRKALDMLVVGKDYEGAYNTLAKAMDIGQEKLSIVFVAYFMQTSSILFKLKKIESEQVINDYLKCMELAQKQKEKYKNKAETLKNVNKGIESIEKYFANSGAASCEDLTTLFTPKVEATPNDTLLLRKVATLMAECKDADIYLTAKIGLFDNNPNVDDAYEIASLAKKKDDNTTAKKFYAKAIDLQTDDIKKSYYYYEMALVTDGPSEARQHARKAIELNDHFGAPYLLIARLYLSNPCGDDTFGGKAVYWAAVDQCVQAKLAEPDNEKVVQEANRMIGTYSSRFPSKNEIFMQGYNDKTYNIGCWIGVSTQARSSD